MSKQSDAASGFAIFVGAILFILAYPFIWLYEQVGGRLLFAIVIGIPTAIFVYKDWKKDQLRKAEEAKPTESAEEKSARKKREAEEFHAQNIQIIQEREQQAQRGVEHNPARVHTVETDDGYLSIEWRQQFDEIKQAWNAGDYDFARAWLQKLAYAITNENTPPEVHEKFKKLMVAFTRDDPLYAEVMSAALPVIEANPGIVQSTLAKQFPQFDAEQFRYAMYYGEIIGDVARVKSGRSYALSAAPVNLPKDQ
ncbi:hypothetical protein OYT1_ch2290 [Ferriphaselus amnicola]|uniref:Uncharacterized protein n=1 Tax=Ferriphaselus amnicola TaxID=1188319 RepID=A0A2Z6GE05_9PROT|nr:hypothetical protein [Ferriphaselus amnicola]BBE51806.1 hypothetical protein OYT1_ch2290 [Ferriphaselus amnicola]